MVLYKACDKYLALLRDDGQHHDRYLNQNGQDMAFFRAIEKNTQLQIVKIAN